MTDYYHLLGVSPFASRRELARAYRRRAVSHHRNRVIQLEDQLGLMRQAFETLSDPERRREYDARLRSEHAPRERAEDQRLALEGRVRVAIAREIGRSSEQLSERAVAANAQQMRAIAEEHELREAREARARRRSELLRRGFGVVLLCGLAALTWYVFVGSRG